MKFNIETKRFILREIRDEDIQGIFALDSDPDVHRFLGNKPIKTLEQAQHIIDYIKNQYQQYGIGRWAIIDKQTDDFIGWSGLKYETQVRTKFNYYDIGYRLRKKYWGQGVATETAVKSLEYGFEHLNLKEISGAADVNNHASNKILQNIGLKFIETFEFESVLHNWYSLDKTK